VRTRWVFLILATLVVGAFGGALLAPQPADAVSREIIQLQQQVSQLLQGQQDLRSTVDKDNSALSTILQQTLDAVNQMNKTMGGLQQTIQTVQANSGSRLDTVGSQVQALSDNLQDIQARVGKLSQQMTDMQGVLQSLDAKVSGSSPSTMPAGASTTPPPGGAPPSASSAPPAGGGGTSDTSSSTMTGPPVSSELLYANALRDFTGGKYDLARQEFSDYLRYFRTNDLASNAQFYLGEIDYVMSNYQEAIVSYDKVLVNYPKSYKLAAALLKKAEAELALGEKASGTRNLREVVRRFPGTDEARRAQAKLKELGVAPAPRPSH